MKKKTKKHKFKLIPIIWFDARHGYKRWELPGIGITYSPPRSIPRVFADIWLSPTGNLVTRFESNGYRLYFKIKRADGRPITASMRDPLAEFLLEMVTIWVADGIDDDLDCDGVDFGGD